MPSPTLPVVERIAYLACSAATPPRPASRGTDSALTLKQRLQAIFFAAFVARDSDEDVAATSGRSMYTRSGEKT